MAKKSKNNEVYKIEIEIDDLTKEQYESIWAQLVDISGHSGKEITMKGGSAESWDENSGLHKHIVSVSLLERAASLVGNPGTNISGSTDMACDEWQKDYERWRNER